MQEFYLLPMKCCCNVAVNLDNIRTKLQLLRNVPAASCADWVLISSSYNELYNQVAD